MFDGIQDPHNFGASIRVSEVLGFNNIIFYKGDSCGITPSAVKASAGGIFHVNLYQSNLNSAMKKLITWGFSIYVLDGKGDILLPQVQLEKKVCLVIGSERKGVRFSIKRQADKIVKIPMYGKLNSLNLSCALSAVLYEFSRNYSLE